MATTSDQHAKIATARSNARRRLLKLRLRRPSLGTVLGCLALLVAMSGAAMASIPDSNGSVNACYNKKTGVLRVIDTTNQSCTGAEHSITVAATDSTGKVANADTLDGTDSSGFLGATATAADSSKLGGKAASAYGTVLAGRINGLSVPHTDGIPAVDYGAPTGVTPPGSRQDDVSLGVLGAPSQSRFARDLQVKVTAPPGLATEEEPTHARVFTLVGYMYRSDTAVNMSTELSCSMIRDIYSCGSPGPVPLAGIDALALRAEAHGVGTTPADAIFSFRLTGS